MRVQWQYFPNENLAVVHTDQRFPTIDAGYVTFQVYPISEVPEGNREWVSAMLAIPGVEGVSISNHEIRVGKGTVFDWKEIRSKLELILAVRFFDGNDPTILPPISARSYSE